MTEPKNSFNGKPTFAGVIFLYWHEISSGWNSDTRLQYRHYYYDIIIPNIPDHDFKSIDMLDLNDCKRCIKAIEKHGYTVFAKKTSYEDSTIEKVQYLIELVVQTAARHYLCKNLFEKNKKSNRMKTKRTVDEKVILRRSLSPKQQILAEEILLTNSMQTGQRMGLALMLSLGLRDGEACGLNFGDIKAANEKADMRFAWIFKSTQIKSNKSQASGKTKNADRLIPVPTRLFNLIESRRTQLISMGYDTDNMPIVCRGKSYDERCSANDLTEESHIFFAELDIGYEQMKCINSIISTSQASYSSIYGQEVYEKSPTAYLLRRNFATKLAYWGLTVPEICYVLGHNIEGALESRNEFITDDKLYALWRKMVLHKSGCSVHTIESGTVTKFNETSLELVLPENSSQLFIQVTATEPMETIKLKVSVAEPMRVSQNLSYSHQKNSYTSTVDVADEYHRLVKNINNQKENNYDY